MVCVALVGTDGQTRVLVEATGETMLYVKVNLYIKDDSSKIEISNSQLWW